MSKITKVINLFCMVTFLVYSVIISNIISNIVITSKFISLCINTSILVIEAVIIIILSKSICELLEDL
jgi:hypothetical protein